MLAPIVVIVVVIFTINFIYFDDVKDVKEPTKKSIEKTDDRKNYINKYLKS